MSYLRPVPLVPLADVNDSDVTLDDLLRASSLITEATGYEEPLLPAARTWRVRVAVYGYGQQRVIWGLPFQEAITEGLAAAADNPREVEFRAATAGYVSLEHVSGWGWLEALAPLTDAMPADAATIPGVALAEGDVGAVYLIGTELVWCDAAGSVYRENPVAHEAGATVRRVHAHAGLTLACIRVARRVKDARKRAGFAQSGARGGRPRTGAALNPMDERAVSDLARFVRPRAWLVSVPISPHGSIVSALPQAPYPSPAAP